ncbi:MAG: hypothetical protein HYY04_17265, partial [Chloroflexi bacterium]|nr:hypothetical protein [Chloroflexota bacterium]
MMLDPFARNAGTHLRDLGDPLEYAWVLGYSAHRLVTDPLHLYEGNIFFPFRGSLAYSDSTIASTILSLPVLLTTHNPVLATNLLLLVSFILAGFGAYLLASDLTGSRPAGIVAGVMFAFNPYRMDHLSQIPNFSSHWIPFIFFALHRYLAGHSRWWAGGFGIFFGLQLLSSFYYAFAVSLAVTIYTLGLFVWRPRRVLQPQVILPLVGATVAAVALFVVVSLPYFEVERLYGFRRTLQEAEFFSARPQNYLGVHVFNKLWGQLEPLRRLGAGEKRLFPGLLAAVLMIIGLVRGFPRHQSILFSVVGLFGFVLSLGPSLFITSAGPAVDLPFPLPYRVLFDYLPGFQSMRVPARFAIIVMLAISVLAAMGTAYLLRRVSQLNLPEHQSNRQAIRQASLAVLVTVVSLAEYASFPIPMQPIPTGQAIPEVYRWLAGQPVKQVLVELPIDDNAFRQAPYIYYSTYHRWTLVNGWRSFVPPGYHELARVLQTFPSGESMATLTDLGVKYVIVHGDKLPEWDLLQRKRRAERYGDQVRVVQQFGHDYVYEVTAPPASTAPRFSLASSCLAGVGDAYPARLIVDGDGRHLTALPSSTRQATISARWLSKDGQRLDQEVLVEGSGPMLPSGQSLALSLKAPPASGTYALTLDVMLPAAT